MRLVRLCTVLAVVTLLLQAGAPATMWQDTQTFDPYLHGVYPQFLGWDHPADTTLGPISWDLDLNLLSIHAYGVGYDGRTVSSSSHINEVYLNDVSLGYLVGEDDQWATTTWMLSPFLINTSGPNHVDVQVDRWSTGQSPDLAWSRLTVEHESPVPEPASCALLALAAGGIGAALKRRRNR